VEDVPAPRQPEHALSLATLTQADAAHVLQRMAQPRLARCAKRARTLVIERPRPWLVGNLEGRGNLIHVLGGARQSQHPVEQLATAACSLQQLQREVEL